MKISYSIGCTGLLTDIPLMVAQAKGFFPSEEVHVALSVELGWASIELKLVSGQLSAANVPPSFPLLLSLKKGGAAQPLHALAITSYHGEAITLDRETAAVFQSGKLTTLKSLRIGVDAPHTLSPLFVRSWLKELRIDRSPVVQLVPLAISQLLDLLKDGFIQGICCAEPIGLIAHETDLGVTVARSRDHSPPPMQSVLVTTDAFCSAHPAVTKAITSAVDRARSYCANPKNEAEIIRIYRKQILNKLAASGPSFAGASPPLSLATLIGFEPAPVNGRAPAKDPVNSLASACATLPGVISAEREIRDAVKAIFSDVL